MRTHVVIQVAVAIALLAGAGGRIASAEADTITIGLFAPTAPFKGTGDRVSFVNGLAEHLAGEAGGAQVIGKVYSSASAFASAVKKGEVQFAVVDGPYAAALGLPYQILASAVRDGSSSAAWQLVGGAGVSGLADLAGKKVALPSTGAKESAFVANTLLGGEIEASYFGGILDAADAKSALTMVSVGKADAAFVPSGVEIPTGLSRVLTLTSVGWPMFAAMPGADAKLVTAFGARAKSFSSSGAFSGFTGADAGRYKALASSFGRTTRKGPMAVPPPARLTVRDLLAGRSFAIPLSDILDLVEAPPAK
jgi:hypothetical protein